MVNRRPYDFRKNVTRKGSSGERRISMLLDEMQLKYVQEWRDHDCIVNTGPAQFDFYLPEFHAIIEFDGPQHFGASAFNTQSGKHEDTHLRTSWSDRKKEAWVKQNNVPLLRVTHLQDVRVTVMDWIRELRKRK